MKHKIRKGKKIMYTVKTLSHGELIRTENYRSYDDARKRVYKIEIEAHKTHSLLNVVLFEDDVKLLERFFG